MHTDALKLKRTVYSYQREESEEKDCNQEGKKCKISYRYQKVRRDYPINSDTFKEKEGHRNPKHWDYETQIWEKAPIFLGDYTLSSAFTEQLDDWELIPLSATNIHFSGLDNHLSGVQEYPRKRQESLYPKHFHLGAEECYLGADPQTAQIGDLKIRFYKVNTGNVSLIGTQLDKTLQSYLSSNGKSIALLETGTVKSALLLQHAYEESRRILWILRGGGIILMLIGWVKLLEEIFAGLSPNSFLVPFARKGLEVLAFVLSLFLGGLSIAGAWFLFNPLKGIGILLLCRAGGLIFWKIKKTKKADLLDEENLPPSVSS